MVLELIKPTEAESNPERVRVLVDAMRASQATILSVPSDHDDFDVALYAACNDIDRQGVFLNQMFEDDFKQMDFVTAVTGTVRAYEMSLHPCYKALRKLPEVRALQPRRKVQYKILKKVAKARTPQEGHSPQAFADWFAFVHKAKRELRSTISEQFIQAIQHDTAAANLMSASASLARQGDPDAIEAMRIIAADAMKNRPASEQTIDMSEVN